MTVNEAIKNLTHYSGEFPQEEIETISANREEALPLLREAVKKAAQGPGSLEDNYSLHFYAIFFIGEFQDKESFPILIDFVSLPGDDVDELVGDAVGGPLADVLYNTYNGELELLKKAATNRKAGEYVRADILKVLAQLHVDGEIGEEEWKEFIRECAHNDEKHGTYFFDELGGIICDFHYADMLPEIKHMLDHGKMSKEVLGDYASCVDWMFKYEKDSIRFCKSPIYAVEQLKGWAMFGYESKEGSGEGFEEFLNDIIKKDAQPPASKGRKIGRNDPCPCGSGKKYKNCCLKKDKAKAPQDKIESEEERNKRLKNFPYTGSERVEGRIYLGDFFDEESIDIDRLVYLGLKRRPAFLFKSEEPLNEDRCRGYLKCAFEKFEEKVGKDGISTFEEYDGKNSIHYFCEEWMGTLIELLDQRDEMFDSVKKLYKAMS